MRRSTLSLPGALAVALGIAVGPQLAGVALAVSGGSDDRLTVTATVDTGRGDPVQLARVDSNRPLVLDPAREVSMDLQIENPGDEPVTLRSVRLQGQVLGMTFFDYATRVDLELVAKDSTRLVLPLDVSELGGQATGLLPARLTLTDADRDVLAQDPFPVEVRGSLWSTYGVFGLLVAAVTVVLLVAALLRLALGLLPRNRWLRASRFAVPGIGLGLVLTFTLSVLTVLVPDPDTWVRTVVVGGVLGLLAGYVTPSPEARQARQDEVAAERAQPFPFGDDARADQTASDDGHRTIVLPDAGPAPALRPQTGERPPVAGDAPGSEHPASRP